MAPSPAEAFLTVTDKTTGVTITVPINTGHNTIAASAFAALKVTQTTPAPPVPQQIPLRILDVGFKNTVACRSRVSEIDVAGGDGVRYRGYSILDLIENSSFLEVAYLLIYGELPTKSQNDKWTNAVLSHTYVHAELEKQMTTFRYDAHPMGMLIATVASLSTFHPEANPALQGESMYMKPKTADEGLAKKVEMNRTRAILRILGKIPTIASYAYRNRMGRTYNSPMPNCSNYAENFLYMIDKLNEPNYIPDPRIVRIMDKLFILLAEHGSNCSTITMRHLASSGVDPYTALSGAFGALFGERKSAAVIQMLDLIGVPANIPAFLSLIKAKKYVVKTASGSLVADETTSSTPKPTRLQGFGHRIYRSSDPRATLAQKIAHEAFALISESPRAKLAVALENATRLDPWFADRRLFANVEFWVAVVFDTLGFPADMFPVLTAIPRAAGLVAHWEESLDDPEYKIYRPRQVFNGVFVRDYKADRASIDEVEAEDEREEADYAKSLPAQANKRLSLNSAALSIDNIEDAKLAEFKAMIERTKAGIEDLAVLSKTLPKSSPSPRSSATSRLGAWVMGSGGGKSPSTESDKLAKTQTELQDLLQKQQELLDLYVGHRMRQQEVQQQQAKQGQESATGPRAIVVPMPGTADIPGMNRTRSASAVHLGRAEPDLLAGSHSPRPIMKTGGSGGTGNGNGQGANA
ncbi:hypothetical protein HDU84_008646 [Entophlyctis sp. JEL0112]|nr:hypothetical protein HDU84_008646 [Entophlyctis sp. JEL0112]